MRKKTAERLERSRQVRAAKQPSRVLSLEPSGVDGATLVGLKKPISLSFENWIDLLNFEKKIRVFVAARRAELASDTRRFAKSAEKVRLPPERQRPKRDGGSFSVE